MVYHWCSHLIYSKIVIIQLTRTRHEDMTFLLRGALDVYTTMTKKIKCRFRPLRQPIFSSFEIPRTLKFRDRSQTCISPEVSHVQTDFRISVEVQVLASTHSFTKLLLVIL